MFEISNLYKSYDGGEKEVSVLKGLNFGCKEGEFVGIFGPSGSGKSTFLHIVGGLDVPSSGKVFFDGVDIYKKSGRFLANFRNTSVGFVFQFYHLLPEFTAVENVMLPCLIHGIGKGKALEMATEALGSVEMLERAHHRPQEMSGGEQQRVAVARAVVMKPRFILADEPTGNLDEVNGWKVWGVLERLNSQTGTGIIMVTHNPELLKKIPRRYELKGGLLNEVKNN